MKLKNQKTVYVWKMGRLVLTALVLWLFAGSIFCVKAAAAKPETPVMLSAKAVSASSIKIQWQVKERQTGAYAIYRKDGKGSFRIIDFVKALGTRKTTYLDETVMPGTRYTYAVAVIPKEKLVSPFVWSSSGNSSKRSCIFGSRTEQRFINIWYFPGRTRLRRHPHRLRIFPTSRQRPRKTRSFMLWCAEAGEPAVQRQSPRKQPCLPQK